MQNLYNYIAKAVAYLDTLCSVKPNRRTTPGNRLATEFFADTLRGYSYEIDDTHLKALIMPAAGRD